MKYKNIAFLMLGLTILPAQAMWNNTWESTKNFVTKHPAITGMIIGATIDLTVFGGYKLWCYLEKLETQNNLTQDERLEEKQEEKQNKLNQNFFRAIMRNNRDATYYLDQGADINYFCVYWLHDINNRYSETPLHAAIRKFNYSMVQFLVQKGANINIESLNKEEFTPLGLVENLLQNNTLTNPQILACKLIKKYLESKGAIK